MLWPDPDVLCGRTCRCRRSSRCRSSSPSRWRRRPSSRRGGGQLPARGADLGQALDLEGVLGVEALEALADLRGLGALGVDHRLEGGERCRPCPSPAPSAVRPALRRAPTKRAATAARGSRRARGRGPRATGHRRRSTRSWKTFRRLAFNWFTGLSPPRSEGSGVVEPADAACGAAGSAFAGALRGCAREQALAGGQHVAGRKDRDLAAGHREALDRDQASRDRELPVAVRDELVDVVDQLLEGIEPAFELVLEGDLLELGRGDGRAASALGRAGRAGGAGRARWSGSLRRRSRRADGGAGGVGAGAAALSSSFSSMDRKSTFASAAAWFSCTSSEGTSSSGGTALPRRPRLAYIRGNESCACAKVTFSCLDWSSCCCAAAMSLSSFAASLRLGESAHEPVGAEHSDDRETRSGCTCHGASCCSLRASGGGRGLPPCWTAPCADATGAPRRTARRRRLPRRVRRRSTELHQQVELGHARGADAVLDVLRSAGWSRRSRAGPGRAASVESSLRADFASFTSVTSSRLRMRVIIRATACCE